jgi:putative membrane protein
MKPVLKKTKECETPAYIGAGDQLILRDELAIDRTRLANERTMLAWMRTALMMLVSGITMMKLFEHIPAMEIAGGVLIPLSFLVAFEGARRYWKTCSAIRAAQQS